MRHISILGRIRVSGFGLCAIKHIVTKTSEASWSYSCDSKVSFDRVQILTPDFSGRRPPPPPRPSAPLPSSPPPSSQVRLRPVVALWHAVSVAYLAAALAHSHSHCLTVSLSHCLTVSLSHCLTVSLSLSLSHLSHLSHLFLISLISLSSLSLSSLSLVFPSLFSLFSRRRIRARATYKGLFTPASKKSAVFFPTSLPSTFPFWSASFRPPLGLKCIYTVYIISYYIGTFVQKSRSLICHIEPFWLELGLSSHVL